MKWKAFASPLNACIDPDRVKNNDDDKFAAPFTRSRRYDKLTVIERKLHGSPSRCRTIY